MFFHNYRITSGKAVCRYRWGENFKFSLFILSVVFSMEIKSYTIEQNLNTRKIACPYYQLAGSSFSFSSAANSYMYILI